LHQPIAADRTVLALLEHAQQLRLQVRRHLADLIEQERSAFGHSNRPILSVLAPVNAPFL
jgi:hypothetical protein